MTRTTAADRMCFLSSDVKIELLAFRWYAWPHLIAPVQHAMNVAFRHVPMLQSFLANPSIHAAAVKDPKLLGAPFIDVPIDQVPQVRQLLERTLQGAANLLTFSREYTELNRRIEDVATGFSLDEEYTRLPPTLKGMVELNYDANGHPKIRIREELASLQNELEDGDGQEICLSKVRDADRKFFLTTPRLECPDALDLPIKFADSRIDTLAELRIRPLDRFEIAERLQLEPEQMVRVETLLTEERPQRLQPQYEGAGVRVRYFGHACVLVQSAKSAVLIDPLTTWERQPQKQISLTFNDLPDRIDCVILSHCHMDHFCPEMIVQLRQRVGQWIVPRNNAGDIADPSMGLMLKRLGCTDIVSACPFERIPLRDGEIISLPFPGEHCSLDIASKQSALVTISGRRFLFLVDSDATDPALYTRLAAQIPRVDILFVGMECHGAPLSWFYGPVLGKLMSRRDDESRRGNASNCARAWEMARAIECDRVYVYAMGNQPWNRYLLGLEYSPTSIQITESDEFVRLCRDAGKESERLEGCRELYL